MKILLIAYYYPPLSTGGTVRPARMARYLPRFGHQVYVLTHTYGKTDLDNPQVMRVKDFSYNKDRKGIKKLQFLVLRLITEALNFSGFYHSIYSWWRNRVNRFAERIIQVVQPEVIIATYPPLETLEIGLALCRRYRIPLVSDFRDGLLFEPIEQKRLNQYRCIREHYASVEREAARYSAAITAIAEPITDYFKKTYGLTNAWVISNGYDAEDFKDLPADIGLDRDHFHMVFTGRFALSDTFNRVDFFFTALRLLLKQYPGLSKRLRLHLLGEYRRGELVELQDLIDQQVIVPHGFVERKQALAFQKAADLLLIITPPDRRSATSIKIFEYLCSGKPILALTHQTVLADIIRDTQAGWIVHPHKPVEISRLLHQLITRPEFYKSLKPNPQKIKQYAVKPQLEKLSCILKQLPGFAPGVHQKEHKNTKTQKRKNLRT